MNLSKVLYVTGVIAAVVGMFMLNGLVIALGAGFVAGGVVAEDRKEI